MKRASDLGKGSIGEDTGLTVLEGPESGVGRGGVGEQVVDVIAQHQHVVPARHIDQLLAPFPGHGEPRGIVVVGDGVDHRPKPALSHLTHHFPLSSHCLLQLHHIDALFVHGDGDHLKPEVAGDDAEGDEVGGVLDEHHAIPGEEHGGGQLEAGGGPAGGHQGLGGHSTVPVSTSQEPGWELVVP